MGTTTQIPVEEYLAASYSPDKEFVEDGSWSVMWARSLTANYNGTW